MNELRSASTMVAARAGLGTVVSCTKADALSTGKLLA
jgi:hypothetical protein